MILQALVDYYEALAAKGRVAKPGWGIAKISYALNLDKQGRLLNVISLKLTKKRARRLSRFHKIFYCRKQLSEPPELPHNFCGIMQNMFWV